MEVNIIDLSSPQGASVNDGINPEWSSLTYISVDSAAKVVAGFGRGTMLGKMDIGSAYGIIPVHPVDRLLMAGKCLHGHQTPFWSRVSSINIHGDSGRT